MQEKHEQPEFGETKFSPLGEYGAIPGAPNGPPSGATGVNCCSAIPGGSGAPSRSTEKSDLASADSKPLPALASGPFTDGNRGQPRASGTNPIPKLEIHPIARLFPLMSNAEFRALVDDICVNGLLEPLWLYEGKVIDGRHRLLACQALNIVPTTREWNGEGGNVFAFVISRNLRRRHLKERQRAMIAARLLPAIDTEQDPNENFRSGKASEIAGKLLNVSDRSVEFAAKVLQRGIDPLITAVEECKLAVSTAVSLAELPKEEQERIFAGGPKEIRKTLMAIREEKKKNRMPPSENDAQILGRFSAGKAKLSKSDAGFRLELTEDFPDEIIEALRDRDQFRQLIENGLTLIKSKPTAK